MAIEQPLFNIGFCTATASLLTKQFYCVKVSADHEVNICTSAGEHFLGVLQNKPDITEVADVMQIGVTKVMVGVGDLVAGAIWETAADGTAITATSAKVGAGTVIIGGVAGTLATVTVGLQSGMAGALAANGVVAPAAGKVVAGGSHSTTGGEAGANAIVIATGLTTITTVIVQVLTAGNAVATSDAVVTFANGNLTITDGSTYNTVSGQIINWLVYGV